MLQHLYFTCFIMEGGVVLFIVATWWLWTSCALMVNQADALPIYGWKSFFFFFFFCLL